MIKQGEHLKQIRNSLNLTQSELAKELGISTILLSYLERDDRKLSENVADKIASLLNNQPEKKSGLEQYRQGRNLAKIIERLRELGHSLAEIRTNLGSVNADLSYMYIGLKPISSEIKEKLEKFYNVDLNYIKKGNSVSMFKNGEASLLYIPYIQNLNLKDCILKLNSQKLTGFSDYPLYSTDGPLDIIIDISGDNISPSFKGTERLGLLKTNLTNSLYGRLFLILLKNGDVFIRRVLPAKKNTIILKKEDPKFPEIEYKLEEIEGFYLVKMVISPDFI